MKVHQFDQGLSGETGKAMKKKRKPARSPENDLLKKFWGAGKRGPSKKRVTSYEMTVIARRSSCKTKGRFGALEYGERGPKKANRMAGKSKAGPSRRRNFAADTRALIEEKNPATSVLPLTSP